LELIEKKVDGNSVELGTVREQVNLAMTSILLIQEEQVQVTQRLQSTAAPTVAQTGAGIMGAAPTGPSTSSGSNSMPPPPPQHQDRAPRHQVNSAPMPQRPNAAEGMHVDLDGGAAGVHGCLKWISPILKALILGFG
jgi:hypothetical protein